MTKIPNAGHRSVPLVFEPVRVPRIDSSRIRAIHRSYDGEVKLADSLSLTDALLNAASGDDEALEAATDLFAEWVGARVGGIRIGFVPLPGWLVTRILDALLPGIFMGPVRAILARLGHEPADSTHPEDG